MAKPKETMGSKLRSQLQATRSSRDEYAARVVSIRRAKSRLMTLASLDGRTTAAKRVAALIERLEADLGGEVTLTEAQRQLIQRAACLGGFIEGLEAQWLSGQPVELDDYLASINSQRRVLMVLGLERRARDVTPLSETIAEIFKRGAEQKAADEARSNGGDEDST